MIKKLKVLLKLGICYGLNVCVYVKILILTTSVMVLGNGRPLGGDLVMRVELS